MAQTQDHTGKTWPSVRAMCDAFGLPMTTFNNRLKRGWTLEQALTTPNDTTRKKHKLTKPVKDFKGVEYPTVGAMCAAYGLSEKVYWSRKRILKWDLKKNLTTPVNTTAQNSKAITDHTGRVFPSVSELCRYYKIGLSTFRERLKRGWTVEQAITGKVTRKDIKPRPVQGEQYQQDHVSEPRPGRMGRTRRRDTAVCYKREALYRHVREILPGRVPDGGIS